MRELAGLAAYRVGRWREAVRHLQAFGELSDATEHLPILMDCQRALHKPKKVAELWAELRQRSPEPDVLAEGRIVAAASLADGGDLNGAIAMLATAGASKALRNPSERHIRQWYLLADLYERAGDVPRAREYFERVLRADPDAYDVADRLRGLGPERRPRTSEADAKKAGAKSAARSRRPRRPATPPAKARRPRPPAKTARPTGRLGHRAHAAYGVAPGGRSRRRRGRCRRRRGSGRGRRRRGRGRVVERSTSSWSTGERCRSWAPRWSPGCRSG